MKQTIQVQKSEIDFNQLSKEATEILKILDQVEERTIKIRKELMAELKSAKGLVSNIQLDKI